MNKIEAVKAFRARTGLGLAKAAQALQEADYDLEKAIEIARSWPMRQREVGKEGSIFSYVHQGRIGVMLELSCETDFVVRSPEFQALGKGLCLHVAADDLFGRRSKDEGDDWSQPFIKDTSTTPGQILKDMAAKTKEDIRVVRVSKWRQGVLNIALEGPLVS